MQFHFEVVLLPNQDASSGENQTQGALNKIRVNMSWMTENPHRQIRAKSSVTLCVKGVVPCHHVGYL